MLAHGSLWQVVGSSEPASLLSWSPNELTIIDIIFLICVFIFRTLSFKLGFGETLPQQFRRQNRDAVADKLAEEVSLPNPSITTSLKLGTDDLERYAKAVGLTGLFGAKLKGTIADNSGHATLFLSAVAEPTLLLLLAHRQSPVSPLGAVNVSNTFILQDPRRAQELINSIATGSASNDTLIARASFSPKARRVKRGVELDLLLQVALKRKDGSGGEDGILHWMFRILEFGRTSDRKQPSNGPPAPAPEQISLHREHLAQIKLSASAPTLWAHLCKDYNPIHMSSTLAKLYGFRGKIAHGNHVAALAIAQISDVSSKSLVSTSGYPFQLVIRFKRPTVVPRRLTISQSSGAGSSLQKYIIYPSEKNTKDKKVTVEMDFGFANP